MAQPFDTDRLAITGEAVAVAQTVGGTSTSYASFSASQTGVLAYGNPSGIKGELRWFDRSGKPLGSVAPLAEYLDFALSPDERTVAMSRVDPQPNTADIWLLDLTRGITSRFTVDRVNDSSPIWSPDGSQIVFRSNRRGVTDLYQKRSSGTEAEQLVLQSGTNIVSSSDWSSNGRYIVYTNSGATTGFDVWVWPQFGDRKPMLVVRTPLNAMHGRLSPDDRWLAYASDESESCRSTSNRFRPPATNGRFLLTADPSRDGAAMGASSSISRPISS